MQNLSGAVTDVIEGHRSPQGLMALVVGAGGRGGRGGGGLGLGFGGWANFTAEFRIAEPDDRRQHGASLQCVTDTAVIQ
jgi:hypothetical protein